MYTNQSGGKVNPSVSQLPTTLLEVEAQAHLNLSRVVPLSRNHAKGLRALETDRGIEESDVVEDIEKLSRKRNAHSLVRQRNLLRQG